MSASVDISARDFASATVYALKLPLARTMPRIAPKGRAREASVTWAATSRTRQAAHSDCVFHCSGVSDSKRSASDRRCSAACPQIVSMSTEPSFHGRCDVQPTTRRSIADDGVRALDDEAFRVAAAKETHSDTSYAGS